MKIKNHLYLQIIFAVILLTSCDKNDYNEPQSLIGHWAHPAYSDNAEGKIFISYARTNSLPEDSDGIEFKKNGSLIERKNAGWCGTPPVTYDNYSGKWHIKDDNLVINVDYWGGVEHRIWKIIDVSNTMLKIEVLLQE